jgi:hypothetical protein
MILEYFKVYSDVSGKMGPRSHFYAMDCDYWNKLED